MEISVVGLLVIAFLFVIIILVTDRLLFDPKAKQVIYVVIGITAIVLLCYFFGVFGHLGNIHTNKL